MCGRYALSMRPSEVRQQLEQSQMPVAEAPEDDSVRQSYNFAPGYHGLVYRADGPDYGGSKTGDTHEEELKDEDTEERREEETRYKLQSMKWGLVPFWTKRNPDYGSMMKTINCRDDSLYEDRGMWTTMKKKKRCIVVAQGFYEWLKKNNGKEKMPHFTKRKDGQLMCFAGLWDCVQFEDSDEKLYTYTIITTGSNKQLSFLHDRMPVILENGSDAVRTWLDRGRTEWSKDLQSLLRPFEGELECYPVSKDVGKVGNNSPTFVVPVNSTANKNKIANFFGNQQKAAQTRKDQAIVGKAERAMESSPASPGRKVEQDVDESRESTSQAEGTEDNAPLPLLSAEAGGDLGGVKRERNGDDGDGDTAERARQQKRQRTSNPPSSSQGAETSAAAQKRTRSATSNGSVAKGAAKGEGSRKITAFFSK